MRGFHVGACPKAVATATINTTKVSCGSRLAMLAASQLRKRGSTCLVRVATRHCGIRFGVISESARFTVYDPEFPVTNPPVISAYGRGAGVGRGLGVGSDLGVGVGLGVDVAVAVGVAVAVAVVVAVAVGVGVPPPAQV